MPIEFQCSSCQRKLRVSDESAGRDARCPQCKAVQQVPQAPLSRQGGIPTGPPTDGNSAGNTPPPSSADAPKGPSAELFAGFTAKAPANPGPSGQANPYDGNRPDPYTTPAATSPGRSSAPDSRPSLPSFDERQNPATFFKTVVEIITDPGDTFKRMQKTNGFGAPLVFSITGGIISLIANTGFAALMAAIGIAAGGKEGGELVAQAVMIFGIHFASLIFSNLLGVFMLGGIFQVMLMMLGADNHPYETSCRSVGYVLGAFGVVAAIPCVGPWLGLVVQIVYMILALSETQECGGGKASAAVLLPLAVCCFAIMGGAVVVIGIGAIANN